MTKIAINKDRVRRLLEEGFSKSEIKDRLAPTLSDNQWKRALKQMELSSVRAKKVEFTIVSDLEGSDIDLREERPAYRDYPPVGTEASGISAISYSADSTTIATPQID